MMSGPLSVDVRQAVDADVDTVSAILLEAANWLEGREMRMWRAGELLPGRILKDVDEGFALVLMELKGFSRHDYGLRHHGGYLGRAARLNNK